MLSHVGILVLFVLPVVNLHLPPTLSIPFCPCFVSFMNFPPQNLDYADFQGSNAPSILAMLGMLDVFDVGDETN